MADDRMRNEELDRNMGGAGQKDDFGKQTPGRHQQQEDDLSTGQRGGQQGQQGQQNEPRHMKDDFGTPEKKGTQGGQTGQGGQD